MVGSTDLFSEQVNYSSLIIRTESLSPFCKLFNTLKVAEQVVRIDHGDHCVWFELQSNQSPRMLDDKLRTETCVLGERYSLIILEREGLSHLHRLRNARAFNEEVVVLAGLGQTLHFHQEVLSQGTADAAVLHLD